MALQDDHLPAEGREAPRDGEGVGAGFDDEHVLGSGVPRRLGAERLQRLAGDAVDDAGLPRIAPREVRGGEAVGRDVQADGPAFDRLSERSVNFALGGSLA